MLCLVTCIGSRDDVHVHIFVRAKKLPLWTGGLCSLYVRFAITKNAASDSHFCETFKCSIQNSTAALYPNTPSPQITASALSLK